MPEAAKLRVLLCYAHPDDLILSCGGTVAKLCQGHYEVRALEITDGSQSNNDMARERMKESTKSAKLLGYSVHRLSFPDGQVMYDIKLISQIENFLKRFKPSIVITHYPQILGRGHQDHQAVSSAVLNCARRLPFVKYIFFSEPISSFDDFIPNVFIDITKQFQLKMQSIELHRTESHKYYVSRDVISTRARFWRELAIPENGMSNEYYEAFSLIKGVPLNFFE